MKLMVYLGWILKLQETKGFLINFQFLRECFFQFQKRYFLGVYRNIISSDVFGIKGDISLDIVSNIKGKKLVFYLSKILFLYKVNVLGY